MTDLDSFFDGHPLGLAVYRRVGELIGEIGPAEVRATRSQVAFRRRRGFACLWLPGAAKVWMITSRSGRLTTWTSRSEPG